ncbi:hypothetical protein EDC01DRAFT_628402 [Geopyxis carbonaria]|nr:hypothetical protein EDC01DRAFT_628402 [Geopyxis carbonaria]
MRTPLRCRRTHRWRWFPVLIITLLQFTQYTSAQALRTLVTASCLQKCFIQDCQDLDRVCVCVQAFTGDNTKSCADVSCGNELALSNLKDECLVGQQILNTGTKNIVPEAQPESNPAPATTTSLFVRPPVPTTRIIANPATSSLPSASSSPSVLSSSSRISTLRTKTRRPLSSSTHTSNHESTGSIPTVLSTDTPSTSNSENPGIRGVLSTPTVQPRVVNNNKDKVTRIVVATVVPVTTIAFLIGAIILWRKRQRTKRLSIRTFMDESGPDRMSITNPFLTPLTTNPPPSTVSSANSSSTNLVYSFPQPPMRAAPGSAPAFPVIKSFAINTPMANPEIYKEGITPLHPNDPFRDKSLPAFPIPAATASSRHLSTISEAESVGQTGTEMKQA